MFVFGVFLIGLGVYDIAVSGFGWLGGVAIATGAAIIINERRVA